MKLLTITEKDIFIYREIYYGIVKPLFKQGASQEEINTAIENNPYDWELGKFLLFNRIDLLQRLGKMKSDSFLETGEELNIKIVNSENPCAEIGTLAYTFLPELKCPLRTEQKD